MSGRGKDLFAALLSAGLWMASFHPIHLPPLAFVALVPWLWRARTRAADGSRADVLGFVLGQFLLHLYVLWWTTTCAPPLAFLVPILGLPFSWLTARVLRVARSRGLSDLVAVPLTLVLGEVLRDTALQGLSWASLGYPLDIWPAALQWASLGRVHAVALIAIACNVLVVELVLARRDRRRRLRVFGALILLPLVVEVGAAVLKDRDLRPGPRVVGLQPNIPQYKKRGSAHDHLRTHLALLDRVDRGATDLLVYAETSFPGVREPDLPLERILGLETFFDEKRGRYAKFADGTLAEPDQTTLLGVSHLIPARPGTVDADHDGYNEANVGWVVRGGRPTAEIYRKRRLAPFGEYLPFGPETPGYEWMRAQAQKALGHVPDLTAGESPLLFSVRSPDGPRQAACNICFEIVFPWFFRESVAAGADFIVNQSNDAWFLDSSELDLVDQATRWRAVECGRAVFRVSNAGISTAYAPDGTRLSVVEAPDGDRKEVAGVLEAVLPIGQKKTGYVRYGDWPWLVIGALFALRIFRGKPLWRGTAGARSPVFGRAEKDVG